MSDTFTFTIDGVEVTATKGQTIIEAADQSGVYIPRLCYCEGLKPYGGCRICTVLINGRPQAACTQPAAPGIEVTNESAELNKHRRALIDMHFVEGNHFCMFCEKSGDCELQALAYRFGITAPQYPYMFPKRDIDATHPDIFIDRNRCVMCGRCVQASRDVDGKNVFQFVGRGSDKRVAVNSEANLADTDMAASDKAAEVCPVGALLRKRVGFAKPIGKRDYDNTPIGSDIESGKSAAQ
ncbi:MAG: 2Fe-2S iron-sulfur cluster-binding protein [Candidatus Alcyoniella australis]|nr:2Fe-2S iron-sulfur cluster-binding protein [Candidatus Alcyoniella australis]